MNISGVIYTTNKARWVKNSLPSIYDTIADSKGVTVSAFKVVYIKLPKVVPTREKGGGIRIDWDWIKKTYKTDGNILCLHISTAERKRLGLKHPTPGKLLGGSYNRDDMTDSSMEFVVIASRAKEFKQTFLHELSHGFSHWTNDIDETHHYDYNMKDIEAIYKNYDFRKFSLLATIRALSEKIKALQASETVPNPRFGKMYPVTQGYGVKNSIYKQTGVHIGTDYGTPVGTPILAPLDGDITTTGSDKVLGNYCYYVYEYKGVTYVERILHQQTKPVGNRQIKKGEVIGLSGNTGMSTGPHCHIDTWIEGVDINNINKANWFKLTIDPDHLYSNPQS